MSSNDDNKPVSSDIDDQLSLLSSSTGSCFQTVIWTWTNKEGGGCNTCRVFVSAAWKQPSLWLSYLILITAASCRLRSCCSKMIFTVVVLPISAASWRKDRNINVLSVSIQYQKARKKPTRIWWKEQKWMIRLQHVRWEVSTTTKGNSGCYWMCTKAAGLNDAESRYRLLPGRGIEKEEGKEWYRLEEAAIGGRPYARNGLGITGLWNGRFERATKHYIIAANLGHGH